MSRQCGRPGFNPWVGKIPWRRNGLRTPLFWPGEFHGLYSPWGHTESDITERPFSFSLFLVNGTSVQFSHSVVSDSLWPTELQQARPHCPSPTLGVHPNPCSLSRWCHPTISSSVIPFSCPQSFPASGSFKWVSSSQQVVKVLGFQLQHQSFLWAHRTYLL